jgi:hypothetical protein
MKFKSILMSALLLSGLMAGHASAVTCTLSVSSNYIPVGQPFTFGVYINPGLLPGPLPPPSFRPYSVVFYGTKNGVSDIPAGGETYPALFPNYYSTLTGYGNPGGFSGNYLRYALIYANGQLACVTNSVSVTLQ